MLTLDDKTGRIEITVFSDVLEKHRENLNTDKVIIASGEVSLDDFSGRLRMQVKELYDIESARERFAKCMVIQVNADRAANGYVKHLAELLAPHKAGQCPVIVHYQTPFAEALISTR